MQENVFPIVHLSSITVKPLTYLEIPLSWIKWAWKNLRHLQNIQLLSCSCCHVLGKCLIKLSKKPHCEPRTSFGFKKHEIYYFLLIMIQTKLPNFSVLLVCHPMGFISASIPSALKTTVTLLNNTTPRILSLPFKFPA